MSKNNHRKCAKCGKTRTQDMAISFHRFPKPSKDNSNIRLQICNIRLQILIDIFNYIAKNNRYFIHDIS